VTVFVAKDAIHGSFVIQRLPSHKVRLRKAIVNQSLVFEHHQRDDIAVRCQVLVCVEAVV